MKKFWQEFKAFISKGNIVDLAIAVIIGAAFNKIVSSLVNDIIMPLISLCVGGADVSDWKWVIRPAEYDATGNVVVAESALKYGSFIQAIIDFLIIALTLFIIFKVFNYSKNKLSKLGQQVASETDKLTKKAKKKLFKKNKKGEVEEAVSEEATIVAEEKPAEETPAVVEEAPAEPAPVDKEQMMINLLTEIRDNLKTNQQ